jgi:hypothetical protein
VTVVDDALRILFTGRDPAEVVVGIVRPFLSLTNPLRELVHREGLPIEVVRDYLAQPAAPDPGSQNSRETCG